MAPVLRPRDRPDLGVVRRAAQSRGHPAAALMAPRRALSPVRRQPDRRALAGRVAERVTGLTAGGLDGPPESAPRAAPARSARRAPPTGAAASSPRRTPAKGPPSRAV